MFRGQVILLADDAMPGVRSRGRAAGGRDLENLAAGRAFVAHHAADEDDRFAVGRPARHGDLLLDRRLVDGSSFRRPRPAWCRAARSTSCCRPRRGAAETAKVRPSGDQSYS